MKQRLPISEAERSVLLDARRELKMTASAHAYVRGSTKHFYEWLASARGEDLPAAPHIWICGDCHVGNVGPIADRKGRIRLQLRDLDQTVIGSPANDVVRLALSMAMAVRASDLPGVVTAHVVEAVARGYERVLEAKAARIAHELGRSPAIVVGALHRARARSQRHLFAERLEEKVSSIPIGKRFWPLTGSERRGVEELVATAKVKTLLRGLASRDDDAEVELLDAAYWVKGCSSLGLWRAAALVRVRGDKGKDARALVDIKEAERALAPATKKAKMPAHHGERVVEGARALAPSLGERMVPATVVGRQVFVRELLPQDLKFELERLTAEEAIAVAEHLASVVAEAHARQLDEKQAADWVESFRREEAQHMTAPAWLWAAVVDLVALHEGAYLEHCREHALPPVRTTAAMREGTTSHHVTGG